MKTPIDIIFEAFEIEDDNIKLNEGVLTTSPFLAYASFKKGIFNSIKNNLLYLPRKIGRKARDIKATADIEKEKLRSRVGKTTGGTVYKFTKEQLDVLADIYKKYGKDLVKELLKFRRKVVVPYQLIKRNVKKHGRVSSRDITGLTKEEFLSALESGRKKILARGENYFSNSKEMQEKISSHSDRLSSLGQIRNGLEKDPPKLDYNVVNKVLKELEIGGENLEGYDREELRKVYDEIMKNYSSLTKMADEENVGSDEEYAKAKEIIDRNRKLWAGKTIDLTKSSNEKFYTKGNFNTALGKYFFSREVLNQLGKPGVFNIFKKTYISILDEMKKKIKEEKEANFSKLMGHKTSVEFNEKEKKVWALRPTIKHFSGNIDDYYQKIEEKDFLDKPIIIPRSDEMKKAEEEIENEIRRFERGLKKILDPKDYSRLKQYRLINNFITVKELKDPKNLFKSKEDYDNEVGEEKPSDKFISQEDFHTFAQEVAEKEFDSLTDLNRAKDKLNDMIDKLESQGDGDIVKQYADLIRKAKDRKDTAGKEIEPMEDVTGIDEIKKGVSYILGKDYTSKEELKYDVDKLKAEIEKFKNKFETEEKANDKLIEISASLDKVNAKLSGFNKEEE